MILLWSEKNQLFTRFWLKIEALKLCKVWTILGVALVIQDRNIHTITCLAWVLHMELPVCTVQFYLQIKVKWAAIMIALLTILLKVWVRSLSNYKRHILALYKCLWIKVEFSVLKTSKFCNKTSVCSKVIFCRHWVHYLINQKDLRRKVVLCLYLALKI